LKKFVMLVLAVLIIHTQCFAQELRLPVLMYHNINDEYDPRNTNVEMSASDFKNQMTALKENGYSAILFDDYINYINGEGVLPEKPVLVTFDDGYLNNYTVAFPILKELDMKATIFVVTGRMGVDGVVTYPHFTWEQAKQMYDSGYIDIQSHTHFHSELINLPRNELVVELRKSKYLIEKNVGKKVNVLAYPYGFSNNTVRNEARLAGYEACVEINDKIPKVNSENSSQYKLCRITAYGGVSGERLLKVIEEAVYEN